MSASVFINCIHLSVVVSAMVVVVFIQCDTRSFWLNDEDSSLSGADELVEWQGAKVHLCQIWHNKQVIQSLVSC